jgi:hypothetical protein
MLIVGSSIAMGFKPSDFQISNCITDLKVFDAEHSADVTRIYF